MKVAIFASGTGTNFEVLAKEFQKNKIPGELAFLFCDQPQAEVIHKANKLNVPVIVRERIKYDNKEKFEDEILKNLQENNIDFIILAGYMRIIGAKLIHKYPNKIINIHPAYLPELPGMHSIERAYAEYQQGLRQETGVTIHYIDEGVDSGPIIYQKRVQIEADDTLASLELKIHQTEHELYPQVVYKLLNHSKGE